MIVVIIYIFSPRRQGLIRQLINAAAVGVLSRCLCGLSGWSHMGRGRGGFNLHVPLPTWALLTFTSSLVCSHLKVQDPKPEGHFIFSVDMFHVIRGRIGAKH